MDETLWVTPPPLLAGSPMLDIREAFVYALYHYQITMCLLPVERRLVYLLGADWTSLKRPSLSSSEVESIHLGCCWAPHTSHNL